MISLALLVIREIESCAKWAVNTFCGVWRALSSSLPSQIAFETELTWLLLFCASPRKDTTCWQGGSTCWGPRGLPQNCKLERKSGEASANVRKTEPTICTPLQCHSFQEWHIISYHTIIHVLYYIIEIHSYIIIIES